MARVKGLEDLKWGNIKAFNNTELFAGYNKST